MSHLPRITIVMPSLNQSRYLEESIQSILAQNYPSLEFMILDGGSTDGSLEIIKRYSTRLTYWHSQSDKGQTDALIQGFKIATGDLLGWINSDDVLLPGALHSIAHAYIIKPEAGLFGGNFIIIDSTSRIIRCKRHASRAAVFARHGLFAIGQPGSFFKRQSYEAVGGLNQDFHYVMDADLYFRMLFNGISYAHVYSWLAGYRFHDMSKTIAEPDKLYGEFRSLQRRIWPQMKSNLVWRYLYMIWQVINLNYLRMGMETLLAHNRHWQEWANA
jgi:glycosyltransferase involved in cell wall biosynthesis